MEELYFCLHLTENEYYIAEDEFRKKAWELGVEMMYYTNFLLQYVSTNTILARHKFLAMFFDN